MVIVVVYNLVTVGVSSCILSPSWNNYTYSMVIVVVYNLVTVGVSSCILSRSWNNGPLVTGEVRQRRKNRCRTET